MPHFFAGAPELGETVVLAAEDAGHAVRSLRLKPGDRFTSSDGRGGLATCRILRADRLLVEAEVEGRDAAPRLWPSVAVLLSPPKGDRLAWAVQKLTEVGVDRVTLLETPRAVRRWDPARGRRAAIRLEAVALEAAKQSRRRFLPEVGGPIPWAEGVAPGAVDGPMVILWERAAEGLAPSLPAEAPAEMWLVVGPEGGIAEEDARGAERAGARLASLGPNVLRTETAAVVGATLVLARYGRMG